jgi:hypothetical protein
MEYNRDFRPLNAAAGGGGDMAVAPTNGTKRTAAGRNAANAPSGSQRGNAKQADNGAEEAEAGPSRESKYSPPVTRYRLRFDRRGLSNAAPDVVPAGAVKNPPQLPMEEDNSDSENEDEDDMPSADTDERQ